MTHRQYRSVKDLCYYSSLFLAMVYMKAWVIPQWEPSGGDEGFLTHLLVEVCFWGAGFLFSMNALYVISLYVNKPRKRKSQ